MHELIEDYVETYTIVRSFLRKKTRHRAFLFKDPDDYKDWLESMSNYAIADALANPDKWNRALPFHTFIFLRARDLVRKELNAESKFHRAEDASHVAERAARYEADPWEEFLEQENVDFYLRQLSDDQIEVVSLHYRTDLSVREIARLMERSESSVKTLLHRARSRLHELLTATDPPAYGRLILADSGTKVIPLSRGGRRSERAR